jgi:hypothetical protein
MGASAEQLVKLRKEMLNSIIVQMLQMRMTIRHYVDQINDENLSNNIDVII